MRSVVAVIALVACAHAGFWALTREQVAAPNFDGQLASVSYSPFANVAHPDKGILPREDDVRADLKKLGPVTRAIRTYSSTGGVEMVPGIDRKSTRLNSSHMSISYAVFCLKKKNTRSRSGAEWGSLAKSAVRCC